MSEVKKKKVCKKKKMLFGIIPIPKSVDININLDDTNSLHFELGNKKKKDDN